MNTYSTHSILSVFGIISALFVCTWGITSARADAISSAQVSIGANGQTMVRNAHVIALSGSRITVKTDWGSTSFIWIVETTGSTKFYPDMGSKTLLASLKIGDAIGFTGMMDQAGGQGAIAASVVRDATLENDAAVISGTVGTVDMNAPSITIVGVSGSTTVSVNSGTIITRDGNTASLDTVSKGDTIKAFGSLNMMSNTLSASKITFSHTSSTLQNSTVVSLGMFARFIGWLHGSGGTVTLK